MKRLGRMDHSRQPSKSPIYAHTAAPIHCHLTFPSGSCKGSAPLFDLGLNTDNGPTRTGTVSPFRTRGSKRGVSGDFREIFLCLNDQMLVRLTVSEGGKRHPLFLDDARQFNDFRLTSLHASSVLGALQCALSPGAGPASSSTRDLGTCTRNDGSDLGSRNNKGKCR